MSARSDILRVFVVSDLHAHCHDGDDAPSFLDTRADEENNVAHPVAGLKNLINKLGLKADLLLCPGDLGDKAVPEAIRHAWRWINEIQRELGARETLASAGNHDVDSRHKHNDHDARGVLQELRPLFPVANQLAYDQYWSRHYAIFLNDSYRIVLLNSAAYHGSGSDEYQRGRITETTRRSLELELAGSDDGRLNILLCHHHPHPHTELNLGEKDLMIGGQLLLDMLGSGKLGQWIVIHGHKHHPKISYGQSVTSVAPIVFAAGSMCSVLSPELRANVRNQVYLLEFSLSNIRHEGIRATFQAWDWLPATGWVAAGNRSGLPHTGGFGCRDRPAGLSSQLAASITEISADWKDILSSLPHVRYLTPGDWSLVKYDLENQHGIKVLECDGQIMRLERIR